MVRVARRMGCLSSDTTAKVSVPEITMISDVQYTPLYKNHQFLYQKYVVERLSCDEIAAQISSVRSTILKYLRAHGIEVRPSGQNIRRRNLAYGLRLKGRRETVEKRQAENIGKMKELRERGYSYWKIAEILNSMKVPTKSRKGRWQARTIQTIISRMFKIMDATNDGDQACSSQGQSNFVPN